MTSHCRATSPGTGFLFSGRHLNPWLPGRPIREEPARVLWIVALVNEARQSIIHRITV